IIFKDDPDLYYYTQGAEQGKFNYYLGGATKLYAANYTKDKFKKIPGMKKILDKIQDPAKLYGGWVVNDNVPIVKDIDRKSAGKGRRENGDGVRRVRDSRHG